METLDELEKEKLRLEVAYLKRPWFKRTETYFGMFPILATLVAGFFGLVAWQLDAKRQMLEQQNISLESRTAELIEQVAVTSIELDEIRKVSEMEKSEYRELAKRSAELNQDFLLLQDARRALAELEKIDNVSVGLDNVTQSLNLTIGRSNWSWHSSTRRDEAPETPVLFEHLSKVVSLIRRIQPIGELSSLNVANVRLAPPDLELISTLPVRDLTLENNNLQSADLEILLPLHQLESLDLTHQPITSLRSIASFRGLKHLGLRNTHLDDDGLAYNFAFAGQLKSLWISGDTHCLSDAAIPYLIQFENLNHILIEQTSLSYDGVREFAQKCDFKQILTDIKVTKDQQLELQGLREDLPERTYLLSQVDSGFGSIGHSPESSPAHGSEPLRVSDD